MPLNFQDVIRDVHNPTTHTLQTSSGGATIFAVVNTGEAGIGNSIVTINPRTDYIGLVSVSGNVNIGSPTVYVSELIPGTGTENLGKRYGSLATSTDVGVAILAKVLKNDSHDNNNADGQYGRLSINDFRELRTRDQRTIDLANCNATIDYTALSNDTTGIAFSSNHVFGTGAMTFNKVNGSDNTVFGGVSKSLATINVSEIFEAGGFVGLGAYLPSLTNVVNVFLRVGTDASNYNAWTWPVASLTAQTWMNLRTPAATPDYTKNAGNGWDPSDLRYVAFGVEFNAEGNTLDGIIMDHVHIVGGRITSTDASTAITTNINTANVNLLKVGNTPTDTNNGTSSAGTLRVSVASDSTGQIKLASGVAGIGFATVNLVNQPALTASSAFIGIVTITNQPPLVTGTANIGSVSVLGGTINATLGASPSFVGIVTIANQPPLVAGANYIGLATTVNGAGTQFIGLVTANIGTTKAWANPNTFIGLVTVAPHALTAGAAYIGLATTINASSTANIGSVSVLGGGIGINAGVNNIGFATVTLTGAGNPSVFAVNVGTNKSLVNLPIGFSAASTVTIAVPTNVNTIKITNMLLNSDATVSFRMKSGVTYLTGNASIGITLNPGGGFIMTGSPDSPSWIGLPSGALVIEKLDLTATAAKIAGNVIYWQE